MAHVLLRSSKRQQHHLCRFLITRDYFHQQRSFSDNETIGQTSSSSSSSSPTTTSTSTTDSPAANSSNKLEYLLKDAVVHRRGDERYGSREYVLLPSGLTLDQLQVDPSLKLASVYAYRNILFGAKSYVSGVPLVTACEPIFETALPDASSQGEQAQAVSTLHGLCAWVAQQSQLAHPTSPTMKKLQKDYKNKHKVIAYEAVLAIATWKPRKEHSKLGMATLRDGQEAWEKLAMEFCKQGGSEEVNLYQAHGAQLVGIEYNADKSKEYMKSAGGAMARLYFL